MALALKGLFDKRRVALTRARFKAWWEGDEFDVAAAEAALETANEQSGDADDALFDPPEFIPPPRLIALSVLWGEGRVRPSDDSADILELARIGAPAEGVLAVLGPGLAAPVAAIATKHTGRIEVFEWREEAFEALKQGIIMAKLDERVSVTKVDLEAHVWAPESYDGLWSVDDLAYCSFPPHFAQQIIKSLKPGACAVLESYMGLPCEAFATAFASSFAEPQIRAHGDILQVIADVGLVCEADEDLTDDFVETARAAFKTLGEKLTENGQMEPAATRELAWEAEAWRTRLKLLAQRRLERRRLVLRKPADGAPAEAEAQPSDAADQGEGAEKTKDPAG